MLDKQNYHLRLSQCSNEQTAPTAQAGGAVASPGLVYTSTSETVVLDPFKMRMLRKKRVSITSARLHQEDIQKGGFRYKVAMLTLTYAPGQEWDARQITGLLNIIRSYLSRRSVSFRYVWVLELTKAGIPHYHILIWLPRGLTLPKPDKRGWWPYGSTRIEWTRNAVGYIAKYASKEVVGKLPKGSRICGTGGLSKSSRLQKSWWLCPSYIRKLWPEPEMKPRRAIGGGWLSKLTGEWIPSQYAILSFFPLTIRKKDFFSGYLGVI